MTNKEFFKALGDLEREKGIPQEVFIESLQNALVAACKKQYAGAAGTVEVKLNPEKESIDIYTVKTVVDRKSVG